MQTGSVSGSLRGTGGSLGPRAEASAQRRVLARGAVVGAVQQAASGCLAHRRAHVDSEGAVEIEADLDFVIGADLYLPLAIEGDAAHPGGKHDHLPRLDAVHLFNPDWDDETGSQGDGQDGLGLLGSYKADVEAVRSVARGGIQEARDGREPDRVGAGGGDHDLRDIAGPPESTGAHEALRVHGHVYEGAVVVRVAVHANAQDLLPAQGLVADPPGCDQAGRYAGHGRLAHLGEGIVGAGGEGAQGDVGGAVAGDNAARAVATQDYDRRHSRTFHLRYGIDGVASVVADGHLHQR